MPCGTSSRESLREESKRCRHFRFVVGLAPVSESVGEEKQEREQERERERARVKERERMCEWVAVWLSTRDDPTQIVTAY